MCGIKMINKFVEMYLNRYDNVTIENSIRVFITDMEELIRVNRLLNVPFIVISKEFFTITPSTQKFLITTMEYYSKTTQHLTIFDADEYAAYKLGYTFVLKSLEEIANKYLDEGKYRLRYKVLARMHNIKTKGGIIG